MTHYQQTDASVEAALQESEQRFRAVWESANDAMALSTPDGTVIAANPAYYALYGYSPEEVLGKNFAIIFSPEERAWAQQLYAYMFQSPIVSPPVESSVVRADGSQCFVESSYSFLTQNGQRTAMLSIIRDITERKKTEEDLRDNQLLLEMALETADMGTWYWDIASDSIDWSANLEKIFGPTLASPGVSYEAFLEQVHPEDRPRVEQEVKRCLEEGNDCEVEFRIVEPNGARVWSLMTRAQVLYDDAGKPIRMIGVTRSLA